MDGAFWTGLIVGLLVGWLIEWVIDWVYWRNRPAVVSTDTPDVGLRAQNDKLRQEVTAANRTIEQLRVDLMHAREESSRLAAAPVVDASPRVVDVTPQVDTPPASSEPPVRIVETAEAPSAPAPVVSPVSQPRTSTTRANTTGRDPLREIFGIGPVIEQRLYSAGILTFAQLAEQDPDRLLDMIGIRHIPDADPASWIREARQFAERDRSGGTA